MRSENNVPNHVLAFWKLLVDQRVSARPCLSSCQAFMRPRSDFNALSKCSFWNSNASTCQALQRIIARQLKSQGLLLGKPFEGFSRILWGSKPFNCGIPWFYIGTLLWLRHATTIHRSGLVTNHVCRTSKIGRWPLSFVVWANMFKQSLPRTPASSVMPPWSHRPGSLAWAPVNRVIDR